MNRFLAGVGSVFPAVSVARAIPPSDPDFKPLYARRNDAETNNNTLIDALYRERAHSVGAAGQDLDMLGYALLSNARVNARLRALGLERAA